METHPPKLVEALIERLVPRACRENVTGDWHERYRSTPQYLLTVLTELPFIVASQIRRTVTGGPMATLEELRRRSEDEHRRAWRVNLAWVIAGLVGIFTNPRIGNNNGGGRVFVAVFLTLSIFLTFRRSKNGLIGVDQYSALSISRDPYRNQLSRRLDGLYFWASGGLFALSPGIGAMMILVLMAFPLIVLFAGWILGKPLPGSVSAAHAWFSLVVFAALCVSWAFVRVRTLRAARAIQEELDALEEADREL
jgi:hypothetical protein